MSEIETINFQGHEYFDDRLFVLYLCKATVEAKPDGDGIIWTTIYHEQAPAEHIWCVVTYRNCPHYPIYKVNHFATRERAVAYMRDIEPGTPLISLNGNSPRNPVSYPEYSSCKHLNNLRDYDFRTLFTPGGTNAQEIIAQTREQFKGIL